MGDKKEEKCEMEMGELFDVDTNEGKEEKEREKEGFPSLTFTKIAISEVHSTGKERFNNNNHWENGTPPPDYHQRIEKTEARFWLDAFQDFYHVVNLRRVDMRWLEEADKIGQHTMTFPKMYEDELQSLLSKYKFVDSIFEAHKPKGLFVRSDRVSLKNGIHGAGPYFSMRMVIESLVTCNVFHSPMRKIEGDLKLYFIPWQDLHTDTEFRVFVKNNRITGVSQQHLYKVNDLLKDMNDEEAQKLVTKWVDIIFEKFEEIKNKITHVVDYVMDIAIIDPIGTSPRAYFIEMNSFGKEQASGSSLFCWIRDEKQLYSEGEIVEVRYTIDA